MIIIMIIIMIIMMVIIMLLRGDHLPVRATLRLADAALPLGPGLAGFQTQGKRTAQRIVRRNKEHRKRHQASNKSAKDSGQNNYSTNYIGKQKRKYTPEITKVKLRWKMPLRIHWDNSSANPPEKSQY